MSTEKAPTTIRKLYNEHYDNVKKLLELGDSINYTRDYYIELLENNDIDVITWQTQLNMKEKEFDELNEKDNNLLTNAHVLFEKINLGLEMFKDNFNPIDEHITEDTSDEYYLSILEMAYQKDINRNDSAKYDEKYDLQYYRTIVTGMMYSSYIISYGALREYMVNYNINNDTIKSILVHLHDDGSFALGVCIVNDLNYMLPEELYPKSITLEQFKRWFNEEHKNISPEMKRKLFGLIK